MMIQFVPRAARIRRIVLVLRKLSLSDQIRFVSSLALVLSCLVSSRLFLSRADVGRRSLAEKRARSTRAAEGPYKRAHIGANESGALYASECLFLARGGR